MSNTITVLMAQSFEFREGTSDKVYHVQLIATSGGYQVLGQHGRRGAALRTMEKTLAHVSWAAACDAFSKATADRIAHGYTRTVMEIPNVPPFDGPIGHYTVLDREQANIFVTEHGALKIPDPTRPARTSRRNKETAASLGKLLAHPLSVIADANTQTITVSKNGGSITCSSGDKAILAIARKAVLELGGTITLEGYVEDDGFAVLRPTGPEIEKLLARARPDVVRRATSSREKDTLEIFHEFLADATQAQLLIRDATGAERIFERQDVLEAQPYMSARYQTPVAI